LAAANTPQANAARDSQAETRRGDDAPKRLMGRQIDGARETERSGCFFAVFTGSAACAAITRCVDSRRGDGRAVSYSSAEAVAG